MVMALAWARVVGVVTQRRGQSQELYEIKIKGLGDGLALEMRSSTVPRILPRFLFPLPQPDGGDSDWQLEGRGQCLMKTRVYPYL